MFGHEAGAFTGAAKRRVGKIEHADGGTLFLDERLDVVTLELPSLASVGRTYRCCSSILCCRPPRASRRDPPELTPALARELMAQAWPGNVRELRNTADRYVLGLHAGPLTGPPTADDRPMPLPELVGQFERSVIADALRRHGGRLSRTAEALGIAKTTLHDKIRRYGLITDGPSTANDVAKDRSD